MVWGWDPAGPSRHLPQLCSAEAWLQVTSSGEWLGLPTLQATWKDQDLLEGSIQAATVCLLSASAPLERAQLYPSTGVVGVVGLGGVGWERVGREEGRPPNDLALTAAPAGGVRVASAAPTAVPSVP